MGPLHIFLVNNEVCVETVKKRDEITMRINPIVYLTIDIHDDLIGNNAVFQKVSIPLQVTRSHYENYSGQPSISHSQTNKTNQ